MMAKKMKRLLLVLGLALLLPAVAGAGGGSVDPNGGASTNGGGTIDPNGGLNGAAVCSGDCHATIDPNG